MISKYCHTAARQRQQHAVFAKNWADFELNTVLTVKVQSVIHSCETAQIRGERRFSSLKDLLQIVCTFIHPLFATIVVYCCLQKHVAFILVIIDVYRKGTHSKAGFGSTNTDL
jgi:hypothetical protein